jgi:hypothetical protein
LSKPIAADMIGTPDPISNLRPVKYYIPPNETAEEKEWRESCIKVDAFNEDFWHSNNTLFVQAKADYEDLCEFIYQCQLYEVEVLNSLIKYYSKRKRTRSYSRSNVYIL